MKKRLIMMIILSGAMASAKGKSMQFNYSPYDSSVAGYASISNRVVVDAAPLLMSGIGAAYERTMSPQVTVGPYFSFFKLASDPEKNNSVTFKSDVRMYGVRGRYFLSEAAERSGIYLMAGLGAVDIKTAVGYTNLTGEATSSALGGIGGAGYQFIGREFSAGKVAFNLGATYANGYEVTNEAHFSASSGAEVGKPKAAGSIFLEGNIAYLF